MFFLAPIVLALSTILGLATAQTKSVALSPTVNLTLPGPSIPFNQTYTIAISTVGEPQLEGIISFISVNIVYPNGTSVFSGGVGTKDLVPTQESSCTVFAGGISSLSYLAAEEGDYTIVLNQTIGYPTTTNTISRQFSCSPPLQYQSSTYNSTFTVEPKGGALGTGESVLSTLAQWSPTPTGSAVANVGSSGATRTDGGQGTSSGGERVAWGKGLVGLTLVWWFGSCYESRAGLVVSTW